MKIEPKEIIEFIESRLKGNVIPLDVERDAILMIEEYATQCQQDNAERDELIKDLLRFCDNDGTVMNGFRTKPIILKLKTTLNKQ